MTSYLQSLLSNHTSFCLESAFHDDLRLFPEDEPRGVFITHAAFHQKLAADPQETEVMIRQAAIEVSGKLQSQRRIDPLAPGLYDMYALRIPIQDEVLGRIFESIVWRLPTTQIGPIAIAVRPEIAHDGNLIVQQARRFKDIIERLGIARSWLLVSIPATWEGIQAARQLEAEKIQCNLNMVVTVSQAVEAARANVTSISVPITQIHNWTQHHRDDPFYDSSNIQFHRGISFVKRMKTVFERNGFQTRIVPCDFSSIEEVALLAGHPTVCVRADMVCELQRQQGTLVNTMGVVKDISMHRDLLDVPREPLPSRDAFEVAMMQEPDEIYGLLSLLLSESDQAAREVSSIVQENILAIAPHVEELSGILHLPIIAA